MARVAIIGGSGFIGRHVVRCLQAHDATVTVLSRGMRSASAMECAFLPADRTVAGQIGAGLAAVSPDVVIDMIAYQQRDMVALLSELPSGIARLVVISSGDVYATYGRFLGLESADHALGVPDEDGPLRSVLFPYRTQATGPDDFRYSYEKILVERAACAWSASRVTILRLPMVYGPGDRQERVATALARLRANGERLGLNPAEAAWRTTRGYVEDVAAAISHATLAPEAAGATFNIGEPDALTEQEWLSAVAAAAGWSGSIVEDPSVDASLPANWGISLAVETRRFRERLGFADPVGRSQALLRTIASSDRPLLS